jgi:xylan 1,4-beta-xylosidase
VSEVLPPPAGLRAVPGRGHVMLDWTPVPGAAGYLVHRAARAAGPYRPLDHGGGDVLAVPAGPYADTTGDGGVAYYAVAAVTDGQSAGPLSAPVAAAPDPAGSGAVTVEVGGEVAGELARPWQPMIGSEHLSYLMRRDRTGGRVIGTELREALRIARDELGVRAVRAHGILCDDLGVYREGRAPDFGGVDRVYDDLMALGLRPVVGLSFMPRDLARDPGQTVFSYQAVISPPKDWDRWGDLVGNLAAHLVQRYGAAEVAGHWAFEVWNEPNLDVFWSGTQQEYFRLYDVSARAIKSVHPGLRVGGPASAAAGWTRELLAHLDTSGAPLDFLSSHVYGNVPLDLRTGEVPPQNVWWTEWGVTPTHFNRAGDTVFAAAFLLRGMVSALGRVGAQTAGDAQLDREVRLRVRVSPGTSYTVRHYRIDAGHSNIVAAWEKLRDGAGGPDRTAWPRDGQWRTLREMNVLDELEPPARVTARNGLLKLAFGLPMPGVSYLELIP